VSPASERVVLHWTTPAYDFDTVTAYIEDQLREAYRLSSRFAADNAPVSRGQGAPGVFAAKMHHFAAKVHHRWLQPRGEHS
jgi:hypothetical protein